METWEMIKELTENPEKRFRLKGQSNEVCISDREIQGRIDLFDVDYISINDEWEEVKEPVSFMEAIKALDVGKAIYCEIDNRKFTYKRPRTYITEIRSEEAGGISVKEILEGKWYIE